LYKTLLSRPPFLLFWLSQLTSILGVHLYHMGAIVVVFQQSGSALQATGVLVARTLPRILLGPLLRVPVDRYPRKQVLMGIELQPSRAGAPRCCWQLPRAALSGLSTRW
jgi:diaminobutyrate-2-oxoglutarate transaminase